MQVKNLFLFQEGHGWIEVVMDEETIEPVIGAAVANLKSKTVDIQKLREVQVINMYQCVKYVMDNGYSGTLTVESSDPKSYKTTQYVITLFEKTNENCFKLVIELLRTGFMPQRLKMELYRDMRKGEWYWGGVKEGDLKKILKYFTESEKAMWSL